MLRSLTLIPVLVFTVSAGVIVACCTVAIFTLVTPSAVLAMLVLMGGLLWALFVRLVVNLVIDGCRQRQQWRAKAVLAQDNPDAAVVDVGTAAPIWSGPGDGDGGADQVLARPVSPTGAQSPPTTASDLPEESV